MALCRQEKEAEHHAGGALKRCGVWLGAEIYIDQPQLYFKVCTQQQINPFKPFVLGNCYRGLGV